MSKWNTLVAPTIVGAALFIAPTTASADPTAQASKLYLDADAPVPIYQQPDKNHPAPVFLICAGNGVYSVELTGLETIPPSSCMYASNHEISASITPGSFEEFAETDEALRRTAAWIDDRIADLESKSEPTEHEANLLKSFKERRDSSNITSGHIQEPPHVFVTLVR